MPGTLELLYLFFCETGHIFKVALATAFRKARVVALQRPVYAPLYCYSTIFLELLRKVFKLVI